jgi:hypothetical protein
MSYPVKNAFYAFALKNRGFVVENGRATHPVLKGRKGKSLAHKAWVAAVKLAKEAGLGYTGCSCCGAYSNPFLPPAQYQWGS